MIPREQKVKGTMMPCDWEGYHMSLREKVFVDITKKKINADNYDLTQLNKEDDIKPNTGNSVFHCSLWHKNISWLTAERVKKLYPQEGNYSPHNSSYQKQRCTEITTTNQYIYKAIIVDLKNLKSTAGKDIESESSVLKDETSETEVEKDNNFTHYIW